MDPNKEISKAPLEPQIPEVSAIKDVIVRNLKRSLLFDNTQTTTALKKAKITPEKSEDKEKDPIAQSTDDEEKKEAKAKKIFFPELVSNTASGDLNEVSKMEVDDNSSNDEEEEEEIKEKDWDTDELIEEIRLLNIAPHQSITDKDLIDLINE